MAPSYSGDSLYNNIRTNLALVTTSHIQRIARLTIDLQPWQRLRTMIGLIHCPAVVVVVVVVDHTAAAAVHLEFSRIYLKNMVAPP